MTLNVYDEKETWKDIEGYDGCYQISNFGRVRSFKIRNGTGIDYNKPRILKQYIKRDGYASIVLSKRTNGKYVVKYPRVNQLVAIAFIPNPNNKTIVDHIDNNKLNNNVCNLQWLSSKENIMKYYKENYDGKWKGRGKIKAKKVKQLSKDGDVIAIFNSMTDASIKVYGDKSYRNKISIRCKRKTMLGDYYWEVVNDGKETV